MYPMKIHLFALSISILIPTIGLSFSAEEVPDRKDIESCNDYYDKILPLVHPGPTNTDPLVYERAVKELDKVIKLCKEHAGILTLMAEAKISIGNNAEAYRYANMAVSLDRHNWLANHTLGSVLILMGDYEKGLRYIEISLNEVPDKHRHNILISYCSSLEVAKKYREAINICTQAIEARKEEGASYYIRGRAYAGIGDVRKAEHDYFEARKLGFDGASYYSDEHYGK